MEPANLTELGYITAIANLPSICAQGILSFRLAEQIEHVDLAMSEVQELRAGRTVPDVRVAKQRELHDYAPLYICARNPMMFVRHARHEEISVLRVDPSVLNLDGVVVTDGNAASDYTRFAAAPAGLTQVDEELTFAEYWTDASRYAYYDKKRRKCAEVLVPDRVESRFITGVYVSCEAARDACVATGVALPVTIDPHLFFR